jgi:hypothetical protein
LAPGGIIAILIGDRRKNGEYNVLMRTLLMNPNIGKLKAVIIKIQHHCKSANRTYSATPLRIPIRHEYCLVFQKTALQHEQPDRSAAP